MVYEMQWDYTRKMWTESHSSIVWNNIDSDTKSHSSSPIQKASLFTFVLVLEVDTKLQKTK